jgi:hypothetical protein
MEVGRMTTSTLPRSNDVVEKIQEAFRKSLALGPTVSLELAKTRLSVDELAESNINKDTSYQERFESQVSALLEEIAPPHVARRRYHHVWNLGNVDKLPSADVLIAQALAKRGSE